VKVAYLLYPRFTALDVVGTFQVLAAAPGTHSVFVAARAGALDGATAATRWASAQRLTDARVTYSDERVVRAGKVLTSAGASAGIDLALTLLGLSHGPAVAQTVQLTLEYDPRPPYDAGTPAKAPADIGELVSSYYSQRCN
jgi:transcriptional regulator GlxA family with amidase domain